MILKIQNFLKSKQPDDIFPNYISIPFLMVVLGVFYFVVSSWISINTLPPHWDETRHFADAYQYFDLLKNGEISRFLWKEYLYYPPLFSQIAALGFLFFHVSTSVLSNLVILFALLGGIFIYLIFRELYNNTYGLLATILILFSPMYVTLSYNILLEIPSLVSFLIILYLLLKGFWKTYLGVFILGLFFGLGLLLKWTFGLFAFFPFLYFFWLSITYDKNIFTSLKKLGIILIVTFVVAGPWYISNLDSFRIDAKHNATEMARIEKDPDVYSIESYAYYTQVIINEYIYLPLFLLFLIGLFQKKERGYTRNLALFSLIFSIITTTLIANKDPRYILLALPWVYVLIIEGFRTRKPIVQIGLGGFLIVNATLSLFSSTWDNGFFSKRSSIPSPTRAIVIFEKTGIPSFTENVEVFESPVMSELVLFNPHSYLGHLPRVENWYIDDIINSIQNDSHIVFALDNDPYFNKNLISLFAKVQEKDIVTVDSFELANQLVCKKEYCDGEILNTHSCDYYLLPDETEVFQCYL